MVRQRIPKKSGQRPRVYDFSDYREYLSAMMAYFKARMRGRKIGRFNYRNFVHEAGFSSPSTLSMVLKGQRNLSSEGVLKMSRALKCTAAETKFFITLVHLNQAKSLEEKHFHATHLFSSVSYQSAHPLESSQYRYLSNWYSVVIREMVNRFDFQDDPEWIAGQLQPRITSAQAKKAMEDLFSLGFIKRDAQGKISQTSRIIVTPVENTHAAVPEFHRQMIGHALHAIDDVPREERNITSLTLSTSRKNYSKIVALIEKTRKEIASLMVKGDGNDQRVDQVFQLNFQLIPVTRKSDD